MNATAAPVKPSSAPAGPPLDSDSASVNISLAMIVPSKTNPGRTYNPERDSEMMESIRIHGVLEPILVRAKQDGRLTGHYEIVAGERRYHCALKAGRSTIPAVVRVLTDAQALELQTIENDQREDLDPLAKAAAYRRLYGEYRKNGMEAKAAKDMMVQRLGRKLRTVEQSIALGNLCPEAEKELVAGTITLSHAYEIARRPGKTQKVILEYLDEETYDNDGRLEGPSVRELKAFIADECDHFLGAAPFDKTSTTLLAGAGACTACPKNSAVNTSLVDVEEGNKKPAKAMCTDAECWSQKVKNNLVQIETTAKKAGEEVVHLSAAFYDSDAPKGAKPQTGWKKVKAGSCKYAVVGIVVHTDADSIVRIGDKFHVCMMTNICKTHWGSGGRSVSPSHSVSSPLSDAEKKKRLTESRGKKLDQAFRAQATAAIRKGVTSLSSEDLRDVALQLAHHMDRRHRNPVYAAMGWKVSNSAYGPSVPDKQIAALKPADVAAFVALMVLASKVLPGLEDYWPNTQVKLEPFAKRHKVNLAAIRKTAEEPLREKFTEIDARKKKAAPAQTSAAKKGGKRV